MLTAVKGLMGTIFLVTLYGIIICASPGVVLPESPSEQVNVVVVGVHIYVYRVIPCYFSHPPILTILDYALKFITGCFGYLMKEFQVRVCNSN